VYSVEAIQAFLCIGAGRGVQTGIFLSPEFFEEVKIEENDEIY
jgi:hypothetical protein